jgi:protein arginine kinase
LDAALKAAEEQGEGFWTVYRGLAAAERDALVADRLISPEFDVSGAHRAVLVDSGRRLSVMINEEDHFRFQALTSGWSADSAHRSVNEIVSSWTDVMSFAWSPRFGFLSASPFNSGSGVRISAMFHLIGLAHTKKLKSVLKAMQHQTIVVRGLFGENSRAVGAMVQLSVTGDEIEAIRGAGSFLIEEERAARGSVDPGVVSAIAAEARDFAIGSRSLSLSDSLRVLAWVRWAADLSCPGFPSEPRAIDARLRRMGVFDSASEADSGRLRAQALRELLEPFRGDKLDFRS